MTQTYTSFAFVGAGRLGTHIVEAFAALDNASSLKLKVLTRKDGSGVKSFPSNVEIAAVDYTSTSDLRAALKGVEVVISTITDQGVDVQRKVAEVAKEVGKHFVPSEFGMTTDIFTSGPLFKKTQFQSFLRSIDLPYTLFYTGNFSEMYINAPYFGINLSEGSIDLVSPGDAPVSWTGMKDIGRFVAHYLTYTDTVQLAEKKIVRLESDRLSFLDVVEIYEETHPGVKITVSYETQADMEEKLTTNAQDFCAYYKLSAAIGGITVGEAEGRQMWPEWQPRPLREFIAEL